VWSTFPVLVDAAGFLAASFLNTYVLDPITEQRKAIGEIDFTINLLGTASHRGEGVPPPHAHVSGR
jgi:hypothetical protein